MRKRNNAIGYVPFADDTAIESESNAISFKPGFTRHRNVPLSREEKSVT